MSAFQFLNLFQILAMTDSELKIVADHIGHNINIHNDIFSTATFSVRENEGGEGSHCPRKWPY